MEKKIFTSYRLGQITLKNRIVMAPMTRSRAINNIPNSLIAEYYGQRASAGLVITEGTSPSPNGLGYARIPGIFNADQVNGWKLVTKAVHDKGGHIFVQLMHTGRVGHELNLPKGGKVLAPSPLANTGQMWTDQEGLKEYPVPHSMTLDEVKATKEEYVQAAKNAIEAGFDGIELHGANGYLLEQFLSPISNVRTDIYGGSIENRARFVLEVAKEVSDVIGRDKTAIRLSPFGVANEMPQYDEIESAYSYLAQKLNEIGIVYIHLVDHSAMGAPAVPSTIKKIVREKFKNTLILSGGYNAERAEADIQSGAADLIAIGRPFINNPDLIDRFKKNQATSEVLDMTTFYTPGEKGYTDYSVYA